jgi:hypothetical protein
MEWACVALGRCDVDLSHFECSKCDHLLILPVKPVGPNVHQAELVASL